MKLFKAKSVLSVSVKIQIKLSKLTLNIINIESNASKVPLYNLKTLKFFPAKSILQFLLLNIKLLINKFFKQKTGPGKK